MIELLKCLATGLGVIAIALLILGLAIASFKLMGMHPTIGHVYAVFMTLLIAFIAGWAIRNS
jgi:hypothetical protein